MTGEALFADKQTAEHLEESSAEPIPIQMTKPTSSEAPPPAAMGSTKHALDLEINTGTIVFGLFAALSVLVCLVRGVVPIYLGESAVWAGLAWYWHKRNFNHPKLNLILLIAAVLVASGEGFMVGRHYNSHSYTYLKEGNIQYRVDTSQGRTDRLSTVGWFPVSFDSQPETLPDNAITGILLSNGKWDSGLFGKPDNVCFEVQNDSGYVLRDIAVHISLDPKPPDDGFGDLLIARNLINMKVQFGGLLDQGLQTRFCGEAPTFPTGSKWSYDNLSAKGWKQ